MLLEKPRVVGTCLLCAEIDVWEVSTFVSEWKGAIHQ